MDADRFDTLSRSLSQARSRRIAVMTALGGTLGFLGVSETDAKKGKAKKKKKKKKPSSPPVSPSPSSPPPPPPPPPPELVYTCTGPTQSNSVSGIARVAQSFIPGSSGPLRQIVFPVDKASGSLGDYIVQLLAIDGDVPSHLPQGVLAQAIVPNSAVAAGQNVTVTADFNGPPLVQGTIYAAALSRPGPDSFHHHFRNDSLCVGKLFFALPGAPFAVYDPQYDMFVSVFIS